jgi:hypothetical protein
MSRISLMMLAITVLVFFTACHAPSTPAPTSTLTPIATPSPTATLEPTAAAIELETYSVYTAVLSRIPPDEDRVFVLDSESYDTIDDYPSSDPLEYIGRAVKGLEESTLANFVEVADVSVPLKDLFGPGLTVELLTPEERVEIFAGELDLKWTAFYEVYPTAGGIQRISQVGFNTQMTQALVDLLVQGNMVACRGQYFLLEKDDGQWKIVLSVQNAIC